AREVKALKNLIEGHLEGYDILSPCNYPSYWSTYYFRKKKPIVWVSSEVFGPYNTARDIYERSRIFRLATRAAAALDRQIVRRSVDEIVTCSDYNRGLIKERYGLEARVIPTAVDYEFFKEEPSKTKEELSLQEGYIMLQVGALVRRKNQILSIRALKKLKERLPEAKLIIVGSGPWENTLKSEASRLSLDKDVIFKGAVSEEELRALYHACNLNLYPVEEQTWGLVPFEALAAGKLSLVSEDSGAGQVMKKHEICYPINPSVEGIVKGVLEIHKDLDRFKEAIERGIAYIRKNLTWERYAEGMAEAYEEAFNRKMYTF
ncbi:glycosyltransferase family 4 protein, partial [Candidatus Bathyarchaeota archaeon]|nr:glycosyltransferase family 4 protein [Candidatus Bathyarchaeota archaeon]